QGRRRRLSRSLRRRRRCGRLRPATFFCGDRMTTSEPKPNTEAVVNEDVPDVGAALTAVFEQKNADGSPRWKLEDYHSTFPPLLLSLMAHTPFLEMSP